MAVVKVTAPTEFTGDRCGVFFRNGEATADTEQDAAAVAYFRRRGYHVTYPDDEVVELVGDGSGEALPEIPDRPNARDSKDTWADYADALGIEVDGMSKPEIVDAVERHHADAPEADADDTDQEGDANDES